ncbi:MAG: CvpA family protein [Oscillospiraceae bacterium]|nr:CvpA family protein [Oscillospiraceae bacterium]
MNVQGYYYDIAIAIIALIFMIIGRKKGFLQIAVKFVGGIAAVICSYVVSILGGVFIYDILLRDKILNAVKDILPNASGAEDFLEKLGSKIAILPGNAGAYGTEKVEELRETISKSLSNAPATITDTIINTVAVTIIKAVLFVLLFLLFMLIVKLVSKLFRVVNKVPVVGPVNKFFGGIVGIVYGLLWIAVLSVVIYLVIKSMDGGKGIFTEEIINESYVYKYIYTFVCGIMS